MGTSLKSKLYAHAHIKVESALYVKVSPPLHPISFKTLTFPDNQTTEKVAKTQHLHNIIALLLHQNQNIF